MTALCKLNGYLVLMSTEKSVTGQGRCPICKGTEFRDAPHGWVECVTDECSFAVLKKHLERTPDDVANLIGAYI